jgi:hypothetical protein
MKKNRRDFLENVMNIRAYGGWSRPNGAEISPVWFDHQGMAWYAPAGDFERYREMLLVFTRNCPAKYQLYRDWGP